MSRRCGRLWCPTVPAEIVASTPGTYHGNQAAFHMTQSAEPRQTPVVSDTAPHRFRALVAPGRCRRQLQTHEFGFDAQSKPSNPSKPSEPIDNTKVCGAHSGNEPDSPRAGSTVTLRPAIARSVAELSRVRLEPALGTLGGKIERVKSPRPGSTNEAASEKVGQLTSPLQQTPSLAQASENRPQRSIALQPIHHQKRRRESTPPSSTALRFPTTTATMTSTIGIPIKLLNEAQVRNP